MRAASLARYLPAERIRLDVLTARNASAVGVDASLLSSIPDGVTVHRTLTLDLPFRIKKAIKRLVTGQSKASKGKMPDGATPGRKARLSQMLGDFLSPDPQVTWVPILRRAARTIIRKRKIDLVLITVPPFSSLLLAEHLRRKFPDLSIVLDFRDEWLTTTFNLVSFLFSNTEKGHRLAQKIERHSIQAATAVVAVTEAARQEILGRYPDLCEDKFHLINNGFDGASITRTPLRAKPQADQKIVVTFVGTVYASTEPSNLVAALHALPKTVKDRFIVRFVGHVEGEEYREMLLSLGNMVELVGFLPQHKALALMDETDYVLLINHDPLNVGGKFYDYVGAGKPILGAVHPDGETRRLMELLRAGWWAGNRDTESIGRLFIDAANRADRLPQVFRPDFAGIAQFERQVLAQRYAELLHSIVEQHAAPDRGMQARYLLAR